MNDTNNFEKTILPIIFVNRAHWLGKIIYIYIHVFFVVFLILSRFVLSRLRIISNYTTVTLIYTSSISVTREKRRRVYFLYNFCKLYSAAKFVRGNYILPFLFIVSFCISIIISLPATLINSTSVSTTSIEIKIIHIFFFFLTFSIKRRKEFWFNSQNQQLFPTRERSMIVSIFWRI